MDTVVFGGDPGQCTQTKDGVRCMRPNVRHLRHYGRTLSRTESWDFDYTPTEPDLESYIQAIYALRDLDEALEPVTGQRAFPEEES